MFLSEKLSSLTSVDNLYKLPDFLPEKLAVRPKTERFAFFSNSYCCFCLSYYRLIKSSLLFLSDLSLSLPLRLLDLSLSEYFSSFIAGGMLKCVMGLETPLLIEILWSFVDISTTDDLIFRFDSSCICSRRSLQITLKPLILKNSITRSFRIFFSSSGSTI